ncbi:hypothetical protein LCGC14_1656440 [marine sediment metagenome]|uniref:Uncharacterized protein n=1 Tax=marine sediment metagenome TaxID=412755 RepID=A0A0F9HVX7_9ZZZZ
MANVNNMFPSKWLRASDLQGKEPTVTIERMTMEDVEQGKDAQPVLHFAGKDKGLVLNKTNAMNVATIYGPETDAWIGKNIQLFTTFVDFQGRSVEAIRVKPVQPSSAPAPAAPEPAGPHDPLDEIPF